MKIDTYADLDRIKLDFNPIVINKFGSIGVTMRFFTDFGNRKIVSSICAYPNGAEPQRADNLTRAFTYLRNYGIVNHDDIPSKYAFGAIIPVRGANRAVYMKPRMDKRNFVADRKPVFKYEGAIETPFGTIDIVGRYDGKQIHYDFNAKPFDARHPARFKEDALEAALVWMQHADDRPYEKWIDDVMPKQALLRTRKRGVYNAN